VSNSTRMPTRRSVRLHCVRMQGLDSLVGKNGTHSSCASFKKLTTPFSLLFLSCPGKPGARLNPFNFPSTRNCATKPVTTMSLTSAPCDPSAKGRYDSCGRSSLIPSGSGNLVGSRDAVAMSKCRIPPFLMACAYRQSVILGRVLDTRRMGAGGELRRRVSTTYERRAMDAPAEALLASCCIFGQCVE
jgi:hypothetical protein